MSNIDSPNHLDIGLISHRCGTPAHLVCRRNESHMDFSFLLAKNKLNHVLLPCLPLHRGFNFHVDMSDTFLKGRVNKLASFFFYHTERSLAFSLPCRFPQPRQYSKRGKGRDESHRLWPSDDFGEVSRSRTPFWSVVIFTIEVHSFPPSSFE